MPLLTNNRQRLANRHECESFVFEHLGREFTAYFSRHEGRFAELFLRGWKSGSDMESMIDEDAIKTSVLLQHGYSVDDLRKSQVKEPNGRGSTAIGRLLDLLSSDERAAKKDQEAIQK
jgi:hypothetical protein